MQSTTKREIRSINNAATLTDEIEVVKARIYLQEIELKERLKKAPGEAVRSGAAAIIPAFLTTKLTGASVSTIMSVIKLGFGGKKAIGGVIGSVAKLGLFTALKKGFSTLTAKK